MIYINEKPEIIKEILSTCSPPHEHVLEILEKDLEKLTENNMRESGKMVNMIVDFLLMTTMRITNKFPIHYDYHDILNDLKMLVPANSEKYENLEPEIQKMIYAKRKKAQVYIEDWILEFIKSEIALEKEFLAKTFKRVTISMDEINKLL